MATIPTLPTLPTLPSLPTLPTLPSFTIPEINLDSIMGAPKLAASVFTTGVKESVATPDIYKTITGISGRSPITSIQALDLKPDTSLFDSIDGSETAAFLAKAKEGIKFDTSVLTDRINGATGDLKASFGGLTTAMKKNSLIDTYKDSAKYVLTTVKDVNSLVKITKAGDARAIGNFVNKFTGTEALKNIDKGAVGGVLSSVIKTSSNLGIGNVFTTVTSALNNKGTTNSLTRTLLPTVVKNSDSRLLNELANSSGAKLIGALSPAFSKDFSKNYTFNGTNTKNLSSFDSILGSFKNINNDWDKRTRGTSGNTATDLWSIASGSKDFQKLLFTGISYWTKEQKKNPATVPPVPINPMHMLVSKFSEVSVGAAIRRDFPKVALMSLYNAKLPRKNSLVNGTRPLNNTQLLDPRLLGSVLSKLFK